MNDLQTTIIIALIIAFVAMLIAGAKNKIVIYYDVKDLLISFSPWAAIIAALILLGVYQHDGELDSDNLSGIQVFILYAGIGLSISLFIWSISLSVKYNRNIVLGIVIGIFKILSAFLVIFVALTSIAKMFDEKSKTNNFITVAILGLIFWIGHILINGEQVYLAKGWLLPNGKSDGYST